AIPIIAGILAIFVLQDAPGIKKAEGQDYWKETFYGFRKDVFRKNKMIYVCLAAACIIGIAQQTFFSYLINFLIVTLGLGDGFVIPMAVIIVGAAVFTAVMGILFDKKGRRHFYYPLLGIMILGILSFWAIQFTQGTLRNIILYAGGVLMMGGILSLTGAFTSSFQDNLPEGTEGRFQGVRMCFTVLIPMIVGPIISLIIGLDAMGMNGDNFVPPYTMFLAAAVVALLAAIPIRYVRNQ
ncbi:MAG: MFS transporter, partial [Erysipelotrichales bacterium]|nr:MFS transporter [Erysipelotrichales bacterium]